MPEFFDGMMSPGKFELSMIYGWAVYETTTEYGHRGALVGVFDTKEKATTAAKGVGWYHSEGLIDTVKLLLVGSGLGQVVFMVNAPTPLVINRKLADITKMRREAALAKLTPEDIKLLGIRVEK